MKLIPDFIRRMFHTGTAPEGQWRPTAGIGELGNVFDIPFGDGFQRNLGGTYDANGTVMACTMVLSRVLAASYPNHVRINDKGGKDIITNSAAARLILRPNPAQNAMDWVSYVIFCLCLSGNCYFYVKRNERYEPIELIPLPPRSNRAFISPTDGELYYEISGSNEFPEVLDFDYVAPARNILHYKLPSRTSVLHGDSLISYAYGSIAINSAIQGSSAAFYLNMNRPSGILSTDQPLTASQMNELRTKFDEVSKGMNQGKVPILGMGLKWLPMSITANDAQILENYNVSVLDICRIFGVPIQLLGQANNGTNSSVATLLGQFKTGNLLYMAELIEFGLEELFKFDHRVNTFMFDLDNVARADFATEIETLSKAVQNAIYSPNEARNRVGLDAVPYGAEPRIQAQNVRLQDAEPADSAPSAGQPASNQPTAEDLAAAEAAALLEADNEASSIAEAKALLNELITKAQKDLGNETNRA